METISQKKQLKENMIFWFVFHLILLCIILACIWPVYKQNQNLQTKLVQLQNDVKSLQQQNEYYKKKIEALEKDPQYVEFLLRTKLRYAKKGEKFF